ncbi:DNA ligase LigA-related protein [Allofournierella massiliensis]
MRELIGKIHDADMAYYQQDRPIMTDREYDQLVDELQALETETGLILSNSPTQHVGGEILDELVPVRHTKPMLSAGKTKQVEDLVKFAAGRAVLLSWKMDGLTIVLRYENGGLQQAITRGRDGIIGEDVTHTVRTFLNVPLTIPIREPFEVRGEGVISWDNFEKVNLSLGGDYTHPRNLAAGSVRKLDSGESRKRKLEFWAFDLVSDTLEYESKLAQQELLQNSGFSVVPYIFLPESHTDQEVRDAVGAFQPKHFAY